MGKLLPGLPASDDEAVERHFRQPKISWTRLHHTLSFRVDPRLIVLDYTAEALNRGKQKVRLYERPGYSRCTADADRPKML